MNIKQRFIYKASIGFALGVFIVILINVIFAAVSEPDAVDLYSNADGGRTLIQYMLEMLTAGLLGVVGNGGSVVYEIESWSIIKSTSTHFVFTMTAYTIIGLFNGWLLPTHSIVNVIQFISMILAYFMIWLIQYLVCKKSIDDINKDIKQFQNDEKA